MAEFRVNQRLFGVALGIVLAASQLFTYSVLAVGVALIFSPLLVGAVNFRQKRQVNYISWLITMLALGIIGLPFLGLSTYFDLTTHLRLGWHWLDFFTNNRRLMVPVLGLGCGLLTLASLIWVKRLGEFSPQTLAKRYLTGALLVVSGQLSLSFLLIKLGQVEDSLAYLTLLASAAWVLHLGLAYLFYSFLLTGHLVRLRLGKLGLLGIVCALSLVGWQTRTYLSQPLARGVKVIAHRGVNQDNALGNSTLALQKTKREVKPNLVEMDVQATKDRKFIVSHDEDLKQLTGKALVVDQSNLKQLTGLRERQDGKQAKLVSFATYLSEAKRLDQPLLVELKVPNKNYRQTNSGQEFGQAFANELAARDQVHSMSLRALWQLKAVSPRTSVGYVLPINMWGLVFGPLDFYSVEQNTLTRSLVWQLHHRHQQVYVWTVNRPADIRRVLAKGADGIISDDSSQVKRELKRLRNDKKSLRLAKFRVILNEFGYGLRI